MRPRRVLGCPAPHLTTSSVHRVLQIRSQRSKGLAVRRLNTSVTTTRTSRRDPNSLQETRPAPAARIRRCNRTGVHGGMILSERERRILVGIERHLAATDPRFVRVMRYDTRNAAAWTRRGCDVVTVVACLSALLCAALSLIGPAAVAVLLATASHYLRTLLASPTRHLPDRDR